MILIGFNGKMALTRHRFQVLFTLHDCMHTPEEKSMTRSFIRGGNTFFK